LRVSVKYDVFSFVFNSTGPVVVFAYCKNRMMHFNSPSWHFDDSVFFDTNYVIAKKNIIMFGA